ncbi:MAG: F0F1 ATP synthase subunit C [Gammaproteobacteria bacterium]
MKLKNILFAAAVFLPAQALAQEAEGAAISKGLAAIGAGLAGLGAAIGIGILAGRLLEAIARQPELEGKLMGRFFLTVGLTDAVPIIAIALSLVVLFG